MEGQATISIQELDKLRAIKESSDEGVMKFFSKNTCGSIFIYNSTEAVELLVKEIKSLQDSLTRREQYIYDLKKMLPKRKREKLS